MFGSRKLAYLTSVTALVVLPAVSACGGSAATTATHSIPKPSDMPEGGEWTGVYYSPTYGNLHLIKEGASVSGKWRNTAGDKWGQMSGDVTGNMLKFEWKETRIGLVGPSATSAGRGYFQYVRPAGENVNDELHGEWGLGMQFTGTPWNAVKQRNAKPDPESVMPDETQKSQGDNWDRPKRPPGQSDKDKSKDSSDGWN